VSVRGVLLGLVLAACVLARPAAAQDAPPPGIIVLDGRPAPALRLERTDGTSVDLAALRGQWVFVHFWATWCGPCRREMPTIESLAGMLPAERLRIVLVNTSEREDEVWAFLGIVAPSLPSALDEDGRVTEIWQPRGLPSTFLVDPAGRLRYLALGGRPWDEPAYVDFLKRLTATREAAGSG
jgi:thiol-disulfide isomerase/thioredoxin